MEYKFTLKNTKTKKSITRKAKGESRMKAYVNLYNAIKGRLNLSNYIVENVTSELSLKALPLKD